MEDTMTKESVSNDSDDDIDFTAKKRHGKQALRIDESDSDEGSSTPLDVPVSVESNEIVSAIDSEEESNESKESSDDVEKISLSTQRKKKRRKRKSVEQVVNDEHKSKMSALCDEESSSDESDHQHVETVKPTKTDRAPQRMSAKQAEEQMKLIQSESQRLARECQLSVPYHKPKQYSLKDFLNRRTINRPVPMAMTKKAAATIKMSKEELEQYAKSLEDRNKESQEFFRSDSDNSNNDDNETHSKCDEQRNVPSDDTLLVNTNETVNVIEDVRDESSTSNVVELTQHSAGEQSNEATTVDVEIVQQINIPEDVVDSTNIPAGVSYDETTKSVDKNAADVPIASADASTENVHSSDANAVETTERVSIPKESIEIDYNFGESERNEIKTLKDLLPHYSTAKPCLKGTVNGVINLDVDDIRPTKSGGDELLERFIKHVALKSNRSAKEVSILSTDNGVIELSNVKIESDDQNCIHSKPHKDVFKLKEELSLRITAKRKEELMKKQICTAQIPLEDSDSGDDIMTIKEKDIESLCEDDDRSDHVQDNGNISGNNSDSEDGETNNDVDEEENKSDEEEEIKSNGEEDEIDSQPDGCELVQKSKQRKRIILMDNSDDDEGTLLSEDGAESLTKTVDLNTTSISLDESQFMPDDPPIDQTMSQICENQNRADRMIDSCSKIVPEQCETDNNMSTLFTQAADDISVSELLDLCSGSFVTQATNVNFVEPETESGFQTQVDNFSENEFSDDGIGLPKKSKQRKVVNISDDEDEDDKIANVMHNDESNTSISKDHNESAADDNDLSEEEVEGEEEEAPGERIVEYDSEENEIEVPVQVQQKKISEFFENEAELSESEWGSADEDERNLDKFDIELGDEDEFDQNQLVSELDRIHRRRMLDQDAREVKIIKDTHFEDEEESGLGRQRQYKWKHMENSLNMDENHQTDDPDANENAKSDDENEEAWRRMRYERNNILQETKNQNDAINDSKLVVATTTTKKRISIVKTGANLNTSATKDLSFLISRMKDEQSHRSSLLIRDEKTLANLAKLTTDDSIPSVNTNSKNFLFNVISSEDGQSLGKRKLEDDGVDATESKKRKSTKKMKKSTLSVLDKLL